MSVSVPGNDVIVSAPYDDKGSEYVFEKIYSTGHSLEIGMRQPNSQPLLEKISIWSGHDFSGIRILVFGIWDLGSTP